MDDVTGNILKGYGLTGSLIGSPQTIPGVYGNAMSFDGQTQALDLGRHFGTCFGDISLCPDGYTLSFWFKYGTTKARDSSSNVYFISSGGQTAWSHGIAVLFQTGKFKIAFRKPDGNLWKLTTDLNADWNHLSITWKQDNGLRLYVNGTQLEEARNASYADQKPAIDYGVHFGRPNNAPDNTNWYGNFYVDEVLFFEREIEPVKAKGVFSKYQVQSIALH